MPKPRLSYECQEWACSGGHAIGFGLTPQEAYDDWMFEQMHYDARRRADFLFPEKHPAKEGPGFWARLFNGFRFK